MKSLRTLVLAGLAVLAAASCEKTVVSDAKVGFESEEYNFALEDGPNFTIPVSVSGSSVSYPLTIKIADIPATEENEYSERNVDYRFLEREIVLNSAEDKAEFTVRVIDSSIDYLYVGLEIQSVSNGTVGATFKTEIFAQPEVAYYAGAFKASGVIKGETALEPYSEDWQFVYGDNNTIGFYGLGEMTSDVAKYPVSGEMVKEDGDTFFVFPLGVNNYVYAGNFTLGGVRTPCLVAPIVMAGNMAYTGGDLVFMVEDYDSYLVGLDEGQFLCLGLFSYTTGKFTGYAYSDQFNVQSVKRSSESAAAPAAVAMPTSRLTGAAPLADMSSAVASRLEIASEADFRK